jgi:hypothetical protein
VEGDPINFRDGHGRARQGIAGCVNPPFEDTCLLDDPEDWLEFGYLIAADINLTCPAGRVEDTAGNCVKSDPNDHRDPSQPECDPQVIAAMKTAFMQTGNGAKPGAEAGFVLTGTPDNFNIVWLPNTNSADCNIVFSSSLLQGAFALFHVHPNNCVADLSQQDKNLANTYNLNIYSESSSGLYEYSSDQKSDVQLADNAQWTRPCRYQ